VKLLFIAALFIGCVLVMMQFMASAQGSAPSGGDDGGGDTDTPVSGGRIEDFMQGIFMREGGNAGNLNVRNNNPGNLTSIPGGWSGQVGTDGRGFAIFGDAGDGWDALRTDVRTWSGKNPSGNFFDFFNHYAPDGTGDSYAQSVASYIGVDPSQPVSEVV